MEYLKNQILISMPHMIDPIFSKAVIYICDHNSQGAMGLIINKRIETTKLNLIFKKNPTNQGTKQVSLKDLFLGGPVLIENGIVLHHNSLKSNDAFSISNTISITSKQDDLIALQSKQNIPFKVMMGHCGWAPAQLEKEIENGDWLMQNTTDDFIFNIPPAQMWDQATSSLGIELENFINDVGIS